MLDRVQEPEVMDSPAEVIVYDEMDHSHVNQVFIDDLLAANEIYGEALDIGTGTARIPLLLCDRTEEVRVVAVDLSPSMLDVARVNLELSQHLGRVLLDRIDAKELPYEDNRFDVVMSNSIVHHIPDPRSMFAEAVRVCKPGGLLFFRDLLRPDTDEEVSALVSNYAGDDVEHAQQLFEDSLRAAFTVQEIQEIIEPLGFAANSVMATSDRHWTWRAVGR